MFSYIWIAFFTAIILGFFAFRQFLQDLQKWNEKIDRG